MTDDDLDAMLGLADTRAVGTHWDGCERSHRLCAIVSLVAEVRRLRAAVEQERERCAAVADRVADGLRGKGREATGEWAHRWAAGVGAAEAIAKAIRRGAGGAVVSDSDRGPATADGTPWKGV